MNHICPYRWPQLVSILGCALLVSLASCARVQPPPTQDVAESDAGQQVTEPDRGEPEAEQYAGDPAANPDVQPGDWAQWGGTSYRNNTPTASNIPSDWNVGEFDRKTGKWLNSQARNIKWVARVGSQTYGNPVVADGRVYVGTNNGAGHLSRYPSRVDLGCLLCFRESDGEFLWQHSSEKLSTGRVHDWPLQGICCAPLVEGTRVWFVSSRGHVVCLDAEGFYDDEDDGSVQGEFIRLFKESPRLDAGLDSGRLSSTLRMLLEQEGVDLSGRYRVDEHSEDGQWTLKVNLSSDEALFRIVVSEEMLHVYPAESTDDAAGRDPLISVDVLLHAGLDDGRVSRGLFALCERRGMTLAGDSSITAEKPGRSWSGTSHAEGAEINFQVRMQGPKLTAFKQITPRDRPEADVVWSFDMMKQLGVSQHNMCSCSVTALGDVLFVNTSNGVDESHINIPAVNAPSFIAMNKNTGEVFWTDASPGENVLHGQWSSPTAAVLGDEPQVIFGGGDGWIYSFRADQGTDGQPQLLWKFDANPKTSKWIVGGRGTRNNIIATPVVHDGLVYVAVGQDPEHGEGVGHLWCLDPTKRGDVSSELAMKIEGDRRVPIPHRRLQAVIEEEGEVAVDNPNSAVVWHYSQFDQNGDGQFDFEEQMHRSCGTVAIQDDVLYISDFSGLFHCLNAKTGKVHWTYDMFAQAWGSPLIVDGKVFIGDEDGDVSIFPLTANREEAITVTEDDEPKPALGEINMRNSVYSTPIVANGTLFIANKTHLFAIGDDVPQVSQKED